MKPQEIVEILQTVPLFADFDDESGERELYYLVPIVHEATYEVGDRLFVQGEPSDYFYVILEGRVRLTRVDREGGTVHLRDAGPGDTFGVTGLFVGDFHDATAEVLTDTRVLYLERNEFMQVFQSRARLRRRIKLDPQIVKRRHVPRAEWMRDDEWPIFVGRRHWAHLFRSIFLPLCLFALLTAALYFFFHEVPLVFLAAFLLVGTPVFGFVIWEWVDWRDDRYVVTTQRVVHLEREGPLRETFEETSLDNIQDIHEMRPTFSANLLDFGDLVLQTAGETVHIDMHGIPRPSEVREMIFREVERNRARQLLQVRGAIRDVMERRLGLAEPPPPYEPPEAASPRRLTILSLVVGTVRDFFFPQSWTQSEDGSAIIWRRYWLPGFMRYILLYLIWVVITVAALLFFPHLDPPEMWMIAIWLLAEALIFGAILWEIEDWRNDYFEITPSRIIVVDRKPFLLSESRRETTLDRIQNISFDKPSFWARLFRYGNVLVETAGTTGRFELKWIRYPDKAQAEISRRQREYTMQQRTREAQRRQEELLSWFATYDDLREKGLLKGQGHAAASSPADEEDTEDTVGG